MTIDTTVAIIARLIANTKRRKRPNNLIEIATDIRLLEGSLGSLKAVSDKVSISVDMLRQFLSVERVQPKVKELIITRVIDQVNMVHYMAGLSSSDQLAVARALVNKELTATDIRVLAPLRRSNPNQPINELIARVRSSKDVRVYVIRVRLPLGADLDTLKEKVGNTIGSSEGISLSVNGGVVDIELTNVSRSLLRETAKAQGISSRQLVKQLLKQQSEKRTTCLHI